jgi:hypothetical protein
MDVEPLGIAFAIRPRDDVRCAQQGRVGYPGNPIVKDGMIDVINRPGMGVLLIPARAMQYLSDEDAAFFD